jgi:hypothetical protein
MKEATLLFVATAMISLTVSPAMPPRERNLLTGRITEQDLGGALLPRGVWHPYPDIGNRDAWNTVPEEIRAAWVEDAGRFLKADWPPLPATVFLEYAREGNRSRFERLSFERRERLARLVVAEVFENKGRFLDDIANGLWAICEESYWGVPAHLGMQRRGTGLPDVTEPTVDLFSAETGSLLAWTVYLLGDRLNKVSPLLSERLCLEVDRRILTPNLQRDDFWWMGFGNEREVNNWNPWINSNWLTAALILERDEQRRRKSVYKIMKSLDNFLNSYPDDGGCDEGPGYWGRAGASLFECLEMLHGATRGAVNHYSSPLIRGIGQYIYKIYIKDDYYVNFADASGKNAPEAGLVYRYGRNIGDPIMTGFGAFLARRQEHGDESGLPEVGSLGRLLPDLLHLRDLKATTPVEPLLMDFWLPDLQVMGARSHPDSSKGFYLAAKGGHNAESHNHNDVGNFIVYADGRPVLIDAGVGTYTAKTFSPERYEIWTMQSAYHNLPTINGIQQKEGRQFRSENVAYKADDATAAFSLDIARAYPSEARVNTWIRTVTLLRHEGVELSESYSLGAFVKPLTLSLMTPLFVDLSAPGEIRLTDSKGSPGLSVAISFDSAQFKASTEEIPLADARLSAVWGNRLARIILTSPKTSLQGEYKIAVKYAD